jgi:hypothetical protein
MWRMAAAIVLLSEVMLGSHPQPPPRDKSLSQQSGTATIRGRVVAADSREPLRNARVAIAGISNVPPIFTGDDGRFVFADLPPGHYIVSARKAGYAATTFGQRRPELPPTPIDLEAGAVFQDAELRMPRSAAISGRIVDEFGDPLELATVTASRIVRRAGLVVGMTGATAVTDDLGEYRLGGLPAGTYIVAASAPKRGPMPTRAYYPGVAARTEAEPIALQPGEERSATDFTVATFSPAHLARLTIAFTDLKGEPVSAIAMVANVSQFLGDTGVPIIPSAVDSVVTRTLEPGEWSIFARSPDGVGFARVSVGSNDAAITMRLAKGGRVTGRLVSERGSLPPDAAFLVEAFQAAPSPGVTLPPSGGSARVSGSSAFELTELLGPRQLRARPAVAAAWFVTAILHDGRNLLDETIDFKGGETLADVQIVVSDRVGALTGSAVDAQGTRLSDYFVLVFPEEADSVARLRRLAKAGRSNQKGDFTIENLPPGAYLAVAVDDVEDLMPPTLENLDRFRPDATPVTIEAGRTTTATLKLVR